MCICSHWVMTVNWTNLTNKNTQGLGLAWYDWPGASALSHSGHPWQVSATWHRATQSPSFHLQTDIGTTLDSALRNCEWTCGAINYRGLTYHQLWLYPPNRLREPQLLNVVWSPFLMSACFPVSWFLDNHGILLWILQQFEISSQNMVFVSEPNKHTISALPKNLIGKKSSSWQFFGNLPMTEPVR